MKKLIIPLIIVLATGCVSDNSMSKGEQAKEYLELWISQWTKDNGKTPVSTESGLYILNEVKGDASADLWNADLHYTSATITIRALNGTITSTDDAKVAQQLGTYNPSSNYYGPKVFVTGEGISYAGVDAALEGMRMGDERTVVIPAWMLTTSRYSTQDQYLEACTTTSSVVYTIKLAEQFEDPVKWEKAKIVAYVNANYPGAVPTVMPGSEEDAVADSTFWFLSDVSGFNENDVRDDSSSGFTIDYTGRDLSDRIFDTSIKKVAIDNDIYSDSRTYSPLSVLFSSDWSSTTINNSTSYVDGFKAGVSLMRWAGQQATIIFSSAHGYSSTGSGAIPSYCPLIFDIVLMKEE